MNQELFEIEEEEIEVSRWRRILQIVAGFIFVIAILYFSGIYQFFLFSRTPETVTPNNYEQIVEGGRISVPMTFYIVGGVERDEENILELSIKSSSILNQAGIRIDVEEIYILDEVEGDILNRLDDDDFFNQLPSYNRDVVNVFLSRTLSGINGVALGSGGVIAVAEFTTGYDFRTLAHEVGHVLGLGHTQNPTRLMNSGGRGDKLTIEEARRMRDTAQELGY